MNVSGPCRRSAGSTCSTNGRRRDGDQSLLGVLASRHSRHHRSRLAAGNIALVCTVVPCLCLQHEPRPVRDIGRSALEFVRLECAHLLPVSYEECIHVGGHPGPSAIIVRCALCRRSAQRISRLLLAAPSCACARRPLLQVCRRHIKFCAHVALDVEQELETCAYSGQRPARPSGLNRAERCEVRNPDWGACGRELGP